MFCRLLVDRRQKQPMLSLDDIRSMYHRLRVYRNMIWEYSWICYDLLTAVTVDKMLSTRRRSTIHLVNTSITVQQQTRHSHPYAKKTSPALRLFWLGMYSTQRQQAGPGHVFRVCVLVLPM